MQRDILLILIGGAISVVSSIVTVLVQDYLEARKLRRRWEHEDALRREMELRGDVSEIRALQRRIEAQTLEQAEKVGYFLAESGGAGVGEWQGPSRAVAWGPLVIAVVLCGAALAVAIYLGLLPWLRFLSALPVWVLVLVGVILVNMTAIVLLHLWARHRRGQRIVARLIELHPSFGKCLYTRRGRPVRRNQE